MQVLTELYKRIDHYLKVYMSQDKSAWPQVKQVFDWHYNHGYNFSSYLNPSI